MKADDVEIHVNRAFRAESEWARCVNERGKIEEERDALRARCERLEAALREIAGMPCDCACPLDGGQHMFDCVTYSASVDIARLALAGGEA